jgi:hypothetical protein
MFPFSLHIKAHNISLTSPAPSSIRAWYHLPPLQPSSPHPHPSPPITVSQPTSLWCGVVVTPPLTSPPQTLTVSLWHRGVVPPPPNRSPRPPQPHLPPQSLWANLPACGVVAWSHLPWQPPPPPNTGCQRRSSWMGNENCQGGGEGWEVKPHPLQLSVYTETQRKYQLFTID